MLMNEEEYKPCDCMQYVSTVASMGLLPSLQHAGEPTIKDVEHYCGNCNVALSKPIQCAKCTTTYCDRSCQTAHWNSEYKLNCPGKKKGKK
jgi:hypothetical protein